MRLRCFIWGLLLSVVCAAPSSAALVSISSVPAVSTPNYNLTNTYGIYDWAYWTQTGNPLTQPVLPTNEKTGANLISGITTVGGGAVRGTSNGNPTAYTLAFSDGTSPVNSTVGSLRGLFNTQLGQSGVDNGAGIQLTVTAPTADPFNVYLWATGFQATASLTVNVGNGAAIANDSSYVTLGDRFPGRLFTILVTPDSAGQTVNLQYALAAQTDTNANVSISAVAIGPAAIPEPSTLAFVAGGSLLGWGIWRRRR